MLYVEWFDKETNEMCLSRMVFWKAIVVHCSGYGRITFNVTKER